MPGSSSTEAAETACRAQFTVAATGGRPDWDAPAAEIGNDWAGAFRAGAAGLRAAWQQAGDLSQEIDLPIRRVPKSFVASQQIAEFAVHSWDLATATGQRADFPAEACDAALAWARSALLPQFHGDEARAWPSGQRYRYPATRPPRTGSPRLRPGDGQVRRAGQPRGPDPARLPRPAATPALRLSPRPKPYWRNILA